MREGEKSVSTGSVCRHGVCPTRLSDSPLLYGRGHTSVWQVTLRGGSEAPALPPLWESSLVLSSHG